MALRDTEASLRRIFGDNPVLPVLADPKGATGRAYGVDVLPTNVFVNSRGRVAEITVGATTASELSSIVSSLR